MERIISRKSSMILVCLLFSLVIVSFLFLRLQSKELAMYPTKQVANSTDKEWAMPYLTMQVANSIDDEWGTYNILADKYDYFRYRLNFSFPQQEGRNLRSFRVTDNFHSWIGIHSEIIVRTVLDEVDVTDYFKIISDWRNREATFTLEIVARDIALRNPKFYRDWANLYTELVVRQGPVYTLVPPLQYNILCAYHANLWYGLIDLHIPSSFRVVGEFYDGEVFNKTSNTVQSYYYRVSLPTDCFFCCICNLENAPPPPPPFEEPLIE